MLEAFLNKVSTAVYNFIKKETLAQVFPWELYRIFKKDSFPENLRVSASITVKGQNEARILLLLLQIFLHEINGK